MKDQEENYIVKSVATYYHDKATLYVPNTPYDKYFTGRDTRKKNGSRNNPELNIERSLRRTRKTIRNYTKINTFDMFATFTFKDDRENINNIKAKMNNWLKNQRKRNGKFEYLIVPEFHGDKKAIHFHALLKNYKGKLVQAINPKTNKPLKQKGRQIYNLKSYTLGFSNVVKIKDNPESHNKIATYISKYITKDNPVFTNKNRYWVSAGLLLPLTEDNPDWDGKIKPTDSFGIDYGIIYTFSIESIKGYRGESK